jgi:predicted GIY-YIG superfamily endonuclease
MNEDFKKLIDSLEPIYQRLISMEPVKIKDLTRDAQIKGVYLLSEGDSYLYVGRSDNIKTRLQQHSRDSSNHNSAPFAFRLAREDTGIIKASYVSNGSRESLEKEPVFKEAFMRAKRKVKSMDVRYAEERDPLKQYLLELYIAISLGMRIPTISAT